MKLLARLSVSILLSAVLYKGKYLGVFDTIEDAAGRIEVEKSKTNNPGEE